MTSTILFAVDSPEHAAAATGYVGELATATGDAVVVLHVHEIAVGRWGRARVDCPEDEGDHYVDAVVAELTAAGVEARPEIAETRLGGVAAEILTVADRLDPRMIVVCTRGRGDLGSLALGSVTHRLVHLSRRPMLVVPQHVRVELPQQVAAGTTSA